MAHKRSIIVINPQFQYKFSLLICILVVVLSLIFPVAIFDLVDKIAIQSGNLDIQEWKNQLIALLLLMELGFFAFVFILSLYLTHRIAGPLYKLQKYIKEQEEGDEFIPLTFRKGDYFQDLAQDVSKYVGHTHHEKQSMLNHIKEAQNELNELNQNASDEQKLQIAQIMAKFESYNIEK